MAAPQTQQPADFGFERFFRGLMPGFFDTQEDDKSWTVSLDVPGVPKHQLRVSIAGNTVTVDSTKDAPRQVSASYVLPHDIDADKSEAELENGVLTLKLAKVESAAARRIAIK